LYNYYWSTITFPPFNHHLKLDVGSIYVGILIKDEFARNNLKQNIILKGKFLVFVASSLFFSKKNHIVLKLEIISNV
jgi:hypothetical protein